MNVSLWLIGELTWLDKSSFNITPGLFSAHVEVIEFSTEEQHTVNNLYFHFLEHELSIAKAIQLFVSVTGVVDSMKLAIDVIKNIVEHVWILQPKAIDIHFDWALLINDNFSELTNAVSIDLCKLSSTLNRAVNTDVLEGVIRNKISINVMEYPSHISTGDRYHIVWKLKLGILINLENPVNFVWHWIVAA